MGGVVAPAPSRPGRSDCRSQSRVVTREATPTHTSATPFPAATPATIASHRHRPGGSLVLWEALAHGAASVRPPHSVGASPGHHPADPLRPIPVHLLLCHRTEKDPCPPPSRAIHPHSLSRQCPGGGCAGCRVGGHINRPPGTARLVAQTDRGQATSRQRWEHAATEGSDRGRAEQGGHGVRVGRRRVVTTRGQVIPQGHPTRKQPDREVNPAHLTLELCVCPSAGRLLGRETEWDSGARDPSGPGVTYKPPKGPVGFGTVPSAALLPGMRVGEGLRAGAAGRAV